MSPKGQPAPPVLRSNKSPRPPTAAAINEISRCRFAEIGANRLLGVRFHPEFDIQQIASLFVLMAAASAGPAPPGTALLNGDAPAHDVAAGKRPDAAKASSRIFSLRRPKAEARA